MTKELFQHFLLTYLHRPYIWGGDDPIKGLDCSGFVQEALAPLGLDPVGDQTAQGLYDYFKTKGFGLPQLGPNFSGYTGSIVFFGKSLTQITHVALCLTPDVIVEAGGGGSRTLSQQDSINQNAFIRLRPFGQRKDIVAVIKPKEFPW
jgi:cell wall-associated NlpC family hydrolase